MKKIIATVVATIALLFGGVAPALAAEPTAVNVDSFVVQDPSLDGVSLGNGIRLVGFEGVTWSLNGQPVDVTPAGSTLWLPEGFAGTVTATAGPGVVLHEIDADRTGDALTWEHVVTPNTRAAESLASCRSQVASSAERIASLEAALTGRDSKIARQAAKIKRLRAKIRSLR